MPALKDIYKNEAEFEKALHDANTNAKSDYAKDFIADLKRRYSMYKMGTFLTMAQQVFFDKLEEGEAR